MSYLLLFSTISHFSLLIVIPARSKLWVFGRKKKICCTIVWTSLNLHFFTIAWKFEWSLYIMISMEGFLFINLCRKHIGPSVHIVFISGKKKSWVLDSAGMKLPTCRLIKAKHSPATVVWSAQNMHFCLCYVLLSNIYSSGLARTCFLSILLVTRVMVTILPHLR